MEDGLEATTSRAMTAFPPTDGFSKIPAIGKTGGRHGPAAGPGKALVKQINRLPSQETLACANTRY